MRCGALEHLEGCFFVLSFIKNFFLVLTVQQARTLVDDESDESAGMMPKHDTDATPAHFNDQCRLSTLSNEANSINKS